MIQKKIREEEGFTIIEVLIVLAIAGLIMLIVFLAVPALQRNSRNTGRKNDAGRIATAVGDFINNSNGQLPQTAADMQTIYTDAGTLSQFSGLTPSAGNGVTAGNQFDLEMTATAPTFTANSPKANEVVVLESDNATDPGFKCKGASPDNTGTSPRNAVLMYTIEGGSGTWNWNCLDISG